MKCPKCGSTGYYLRSCCGVNLETGIELIVERINATKYSESTKRVLRGLHRYEEINKEDIRSFVEEIVKSHEDMETIKWKVRSLVD